MTRAGRPAPRPLARPAPPAARPATHQRVGQPTAVIGVAAIAALLPILVDPGALSPFGPGRWMVLASAVPAAAVWAAVRTRRVNVTRLWMPGVAIVAAATVTTITAPGRLEALVGAYGRQWGLWSLLVAACGFAAAATAADEEGRAAVTLARGLTVGLAVTAMWGLGELAGFEPVDLVEEAGRLRGPFGNAGIFGAYLALCAPVAAVCAVTDPDSRWRSTHLLAAVGGAVALAGTGTRGAWLGVIAAGLVAALLFRRNVSAQTARGPGAPRVAITAAVAALLAVVVLTDSGGTDLTRTRTVTGRIDTWEAAAPMVGDAPLFGSGPTAVRDGLPRRIDAGYATAYGRTVTQDRAHSAPLDIAVAYGLVGLAAAAWLVWMLARVFRGRDLSGIDIAIAAGLVGYTTQSLVLFPVPELDVAAAILAGAAAGARAPRLLRARPAVVAAAAAAAVLAVGGLWWGGRGVVADRHLRSGAEAVESSPTTALSEFGAAARLRPDIIDTAVAAAGAAAGDPALIGPASGLVDDALGLAPDSLALTAAAADLEARRAEVTGDSFQQAAGLFDRYLARDPYNPAVLVRAGAAYAAAGRVDDAEAAWRQADAINPADSTAADNLRRLRDRQTGVGAFEFDDVRGAPVGVGPSAAPYAVAVEVAAGVDERRFAAVIGEVLADRRGWALNTELAFNQVPDPTEAALVFVLATPDTVDSLCAPLDTEGRYSCRVENRIVINARRWADGAPSWNRPLAAYRAMVINHELGHRLGLGHARCPAPGQPAPVMAQQTIRLDGCTPNPWPTPAETRQVTNSFG